MRLTRAAFLASAVSAVFVSPAAMAGPMKRPIRFGILGMERGGPETKSLDDAFLRPFQRDFKESDFIVEERYAEGRDGIFPKLAAELVAAKVDLILACSSAAALGAKQATNTIPIVMCTASNPERLGLIKSLARPGGNITGVSDVTLDTQPKVMQLVKDAFPERPRMAIVWNSDNHCTAVMLEQGYVPAAKALGMTSIPIDIRSADDLGPAFATIRRERADLILAHGFTWPFRRPILDFSFEHRIPVFSGMRHYAEAGALVTYGPDYHRVNEDAARYVIKIIGGARPADLPVQEPTIFELVVNLKTAEAMGVSIGSLVQARATHVIT